MATSPPKTPLAKTLSSFSIDRIASMDSTGSAGLEPDDSQPSDEDSLALGWEQYEKARVGRRSAGIWIEARADNYYTDRAAFRSAVTLPFQADKFSAPSSSRDGGAAADDIDVVELPPLPTGLVGKDVIPAAALLAALPPSSPPAKAASGGLFSPLAPSTAAATGVVSATTTAASSASSSTLSSPRLVAPLEGDEDSRHAFFYKVVARAYKMLLLWQGGFWPKDPPLARQMGRELFPRLRSYYDECSAIATHHPHRVYLATLLGLCHFLGLGTPRDKAAAWPLFCYAAHDAPVPLPYAQNTVASYFSLGDTPQVARRDVAEAQRRLEALVAAQPSYHLAAYHLALLLAAAPDAASRSRSNALLQQAADLGNVHALHLLGLAQLKAAAPTRIGVVTLKRAMLNGQLDAAAFVLGRVFHLGAAAFAALPSSTAQLLRSAAFAAPAAAATVGGAVSPAASPAVAAAVATDDHRDWPQAWKVYRFAAQQHHVAAQVALAQLLVDTMRVEYLQTALPAAQAHVLRLADVAWAPIVRDVAARGGHRYKCVELLHWLRLATQADDGADDASPATVGVEEALLLLAQWHDVGYVGVVVSGAVSGGRDLHRVSRVVWRDFAPDADAARSLYARYLQRVAGRGGRDAAVEARVAALAAPARRPSSTAPPAAV